MNCIKILRSFTADLMTGIVAFIVAIIIVLVTLKLLAIETQPLRDFQPSIAKVEQTKSKMNQIDLDEFNTKK